MIRRPPRSTQSRSSAASDVYKRQAALVRLEGAHLPEVARREVRLVRMLVADRREDGQLALFVQLPEPGGGGMPAQTVVLGEGRAGAGFRELHEEGKLT